MWTREEKKRKLNKEQKEFLKGIYKQIFDAGLWACADGYAVGEYIKELWGKSL